MKKTLIRKSVKLAIQNVIHDGCTDVSVFGNPFELNLLKEEKFKEKIINNIVTELECIINHNGKFEILKFSKISHMLVPKKSYFDFRKCALIDIQDEIKYLAMVNLIAEKVEKNRVKKNIAFSYRYSPNNNGTLFDKKYNYSSFKNEYKRLSNMKKYKIIIECDIANFYDRLNIHRLNSTLLSINELDNKVVENIDELLLFWANRDSYGLPVGSNASRILAEAFLIEIDNFLISNNIRFCRFVDDYRFFAKDVTEANKILSLFIEILNKHGLSINLKKTGMRDIKDYQEKINKNNSKSKEGIFEIIRGYSGIVPSKFRNLSVSEIEKLKLEDENNLLLILKNDSIINPEDIVKCLKVIVAKEQYDKLVEFPDILRKYPQFVPYFSDILFKNKNKVSKKIYNGILNKFQLWLNDDRTAEYILISIVKLFNAENANEKKVLFDFFKNLKRNSGIYIARVVLEQIDSKFARGEILELKDYYLRADCWEKRIIVKIILNGLSHSENRPFIKDLKINCNDIFILQTINNYENLQKKGIRK